MGFSRPEIVVVTRPTELQGLRERFVTDQQVKFYLKQAQVQEIVRRKDEDAVEQGRAATGAAALVADDLAQANAAFMSLEARDESYQDNVQRLRHELEFDVPVRFLDRSFLPNFDFGRTSVVVVVGQDGLVANTAKYIGDLPLVAVNPDPEHIDGILLPFTVRQARPTVARVLDNKYKSRQVTLAEAQLNDGQRMLAFNDFFVGLAGHASARYTLELNGQTESQSSSGVLISTGAGSTGWFSSVVNMARGVGGWLDQGSPQDERHNRGAHRRSHHSSELPKFEMRWEDRRLAWAVREPFVSKQSQANLVAGVVDEGEELIVESQMPANGLIFSDGIESDFLQFNSGAIARIGVAKQRARLVVR